MEDTICAISTSMGVGAISIIRISGQKAIEIVNKIFDKDITSMDSHTIKYGHIISKKTIIDEVLLMLMKGPKTYTKEDIIEINCHGGINTTNTIMKLLLQNGCRLAEPGEFTKRAFLNGRIDLTEAEAVNDLILAKTDAARQLALNQIDGRINTKINLLRNKIAKLLANIEVNIDYPEYEDEIVITNNLLKNDLKLISDELAKIIKDSENGRIISNGINIAIIGKPNVGKSSLLNAFLDEEKAIVTSVAGTTRDIIEGSITLNGVLINFIDTAGIHDTEDIVEKIGVDKSLQMKEKADFVILVLNNNEKLTEEDNYLIQNLTKKSIIFVNKNDLDKKIDLNIKNNVIYGNTVDLNGIDALKNAISEIFSLNKIAEKDMTYISNLRQINLINKTKKAIDKAQEGEKLQMPVDLIEIDIKQAWEYLGEITGETYADELVNTIFSNFCLGK